MIGRWALVRYLSQPGSAFCHVRSACRFEPINWRRPAPQRSANAHPIEEDVTHTAEARSLEERPTSFASLYAHWERNQWSALELDFSSDAEAFGRLDSEAREGILWIFGHRFHAEFNVAGLLAPFLLAASDYETRLLLATQVADEHRHLEVVLRIYREVFGVSGGIDATRALADQSIDPVAERLYAMLDARVAPLLSDRGERAFLQAITSYHLLGEGVIARTAQNLAVGQYERFGDFPGFLAGQRLVARDEARHIGFGVAYARRALSRDREGATAAISEVIDDFGAVATELLETANTEMSTIVRSGYGVEPEGFYTEAMRLLQLRLRSIRFLDDQ
jgi:ribonucleotide reductase beta subunit family protein with ferritin-like domain